MGNDITASVLWQKGYRINSKNEWYKPTAEADRETPVPQHKQIVQDRSHGQVRGKEGNPESRRVRITITSFRRRLIDPDNLAGGTKYFIDSLKYFGVISDDSADHIELVVRQEKVNHLHEEFTEIIVEQQCSSPIS